MSVRRLFIAGTVALFAVSLAAAVAFGRGSSRSDDRVLQAHVGALRYAVYLPSDYATSGLRYPVVYFLHGLPGNATSYRGIGWLERALDASGKPAILVAPQGASERDRDPEYLGKWETSIASDLPRAVDRAYRTIASRNGRALVGVSAGGYGAMHLAFAHLAEFRAVESWSGYFHPTDPTGTMPLDLGTSARNAAANVHRQLTATAAKLDRSPLFIGFYIGRSDAYRAFVSENEQFNQELSKAGIGHVFRLYAGGHSSALWSRQAPAWLRLALNALAPAR
jgi:S-formylglutathione hydrolase FrmB